MLMEHVGPNTLSTIHPAASQAIYGSASQTSKTAFHDFALPKVLLNTERDKLKHAKRRRVWEHAFNVKGTVAMSSAKWRPTDEYNQL